MTDEDRAASARREAWSAAWARRLILERRARFVAAALTGSGIGGACTARSTPEAAVDAGRPDAGGDEDASAAPQPCLTPE